MGLLHLGFVTVYLSRPLVSGFTTGAAFIVFTSQVKYFFGIDMPRYAGALALPKVSFVVLCTSFVLYMSLRLCYETCLVNNSNNLNTVTINSHVCQHQRSYCTTTYLVDENPILCHKLFHYGLHTVSSTSGIVKHLASCYSKRLHNSPSSRSVYIPQRLEKKKQYIHLQFTITIALTLLVKYPSCMKPCTV